MKYVKHYLLSAINIIFISLICSMAYGEIQSSENYSMRQCTLTNAGGQSSSDNYTLSHILAQPSPITSSSSSGYRLYGGFRHSTRAPQLPGISVIPTSYNFGNSVGSAAFTITNEGDGDLAITSVSIKGTNASEFGIQNDTCSTQTILPSSTCSVNVVFSPTSSGQKSATLEITSNDTDTLTLNVPLTGGGSVISQPDGDVAPLGNRDGTVNVGDALVALRFALGLETPTQEDIQHGDVAPLDAGGQPNPDGKITVGDALVILRKALGLINFGEFQLEGRIFFGNKAITEYTSNDVRFWFRDETAGTSIDNAFTIYDNQTGAYGVSGLPNGPVGISLSIHETGDVATFPGNFRSWSNVDLSTLSDAEADSYDLKISEIMHLEKPFDNSGYASWTPPYPQHDSPILFEWDPITGATRYDVSITKFSDPAYTVLEHVVQQSTTSTSIECTLASSGDQTHYEFYVYAYNADNDMVGYYMTTYQRGEGWDYRFKIK